MARSLGRQIRAPLPRRSLPWLVLLVSASLVTSCGSSPSPNQRARSAAPVTRESNVRYGGSSRHPLLLDAFLPAGSSRVAGVIFIHGGGWSAGGKQDFDALAGRLAGLGWDAFSIDYRLAPATHFPAAANDVRSSISWLRMHAARFRLDPGRLALVGASAGGNLAAYAATAGHGSLSNGSRVLAAVSWSGPMNLLAYLRESTSRYALRSIKTYIGCPVARCAARYRAASPVAYVDASDPPLLLASSTREIVPLAQAQEMVRRLRAAHVFTKLIVFKGSRHATRYENLIWPSTLGFLERYFGRLARVGGGKRG